MAYTKRLHYKGIWCTRYVGTCNGFDENKLTSTHRRGTCCLGIRPNASHGLSHNSSYHLAVESECERCKDLASPAGCGRS